MISFEFITFTLHDDHHDDDDYHDVPSLFSSSPIVIHVNFYLTINYYDVLISVGPTLATSQTIMNRNSTYNVHPILVNLSHSDVQNINA